MTATRRALFVLLVFVAVVGCDQTRHVMRKAQVAIEPPVEIRLTPFVVFSGYYVVVSNFSEKDITNVEVTYTGLSGNTKSQKIVKLLPHETVTLDPSEVGWHVEKEESISVSASGYIPKVLQTNLLIK